MGLWSDDYDDDGDGVNAYQEDGTTPLDCDDTDVALGNINDDFDCDGIINSDDDDDGDGTPEFTNRRNNSSRL